MRTFPKLYPIGKKHRVTRSVQNGALQGLPFQPTAPIITGMSQVITLFRLQKIDTRRDQVAARLAEIEKILSEDLALLEAQQKASAAEEALKLNRQALKLAEDTVQAQNIKIEQTEAALYGGRIQNPKELQDLQNDLASLKRYLRTLEDQQLEAMVVLEEAEASQAAAQAGVKQALANSNSQHAVLFGERSVLQKESEKLEAERQATVSAVSVDSLRIYDRLRQQRRGVAVSAVVDRSCSACGATLTPADWQIARSPTQISYCSNCGRILYAG